MSEGATGEGAVAAATGEAAGQAAAQDPGTVQDAVAAGTPTEATPSWMEGFGDEDLGFVQNKGWKEPGDLLKSYRNLERLRGVGADKLVKLPGNEEEAAEFFTRLGVPESAEGYEQAQVEGVDGAKLAEISHALKLTPEQHAKAAEALGEMFQAGEAEVIRQTEAQVAAEQVALREEWGGAYDENLVAAARATQVLGIDSEMQDGLEVAFGYKGAMEFLAGLGRRVSEPNHTPPSSGMEFGLTPGAAEERINELRSNVDFRSKLLNGDVEAKKEWDDLHKAAFRSRG